LKEGHKMKTICKVALIAICLLIAQMFLISGPALAAQAIPGCIVTVTTTSAGVQTFTASSPSGSSCTVAGSRTSGGPLTTLTITSSPTTIYPGSGNNWTTFLAQNGITYNLNTLPSTFIFSYNSSSSKIINSSSVNLNNNVKVTGTYENKGTTTISANRSLTAATVQNDPGGIIQGKNGKITSSVRNGATVMVGGDPSGMVVEGSFTNQLVSTAITASSGAGGHALALMSDGTVWAWGYNYYGELGNGTNTNSNLPLQVKDPAGTGVLTVIASVSAGYFHSLALKSDGTVWAWGDNQYGQLGNGTNANSNLPVQVKDPTDPTGYLTGIVAVSAFVHHALALKSDGTVWAWGLGGSGQLGNGTNANSSLPVQVKDPTGTVGLTGIASVKAFGYSSLALKPDGTVWAWGYNVDGELGNGTNANSSLPVQVKDPTGTVGLTGIVSISAFGFHSLALKSDGTVWAWGYNYYGELGNGTNANSSLPVQVYADPIEDIHLTGIVSVSAGFYHSLALKPDGTVWAWGDNQYGELGNGTNANSSLPVQVKDPTGTEGLTGIVAVAPGAFTIRARKSDGTVLAWGLNNFVLHGNTSYNLPLQVTPFEVASPGTLRFDIAGTTACPMDQPCPTTGNDTCSGYHSVLHVIADQNVPGSGTIEIPSGSKLAMNFINGCTPPPNTTYNLISASGAVTGAFTSTDIYYGGQYQYTVDLTQPNPPVQVATIPDANQPPIADPGPDQPITLIGSPVQLDGSKSYDPDGDPITYLWSFASVPQGSNATLLNYTTTKPSFVADVHGDYIIQLVVKDNSGASSWPEYVTVSLNNVAPVANAGASQAVLLGNTAPLDGSGSTDANGDPLTYKWSFVTRPDGSDAFIASPTAAKTRFVPDLWGSYVVQLVVNDGILDSNPSTVNIQVTSTSHAIIKEIKALQTAIANLPKDAFKNATMKNALLIELNVVIATIDAGICLPKLHRSFFELAIDQLQYVMTQTDGCANSKVPDKTDWIIKCQYQNMVYPLIWDAIDNLRPLL